MIRKQGLHHQAHLVLGGISLRRPLNIETSGGYPGGQLRKQKKFLAVRDFVCEFDVHDQGKIKRSEVPSVGDVDIARSQGKIGSHSVRRRRHRILANGSILEHHLAPSRHLPIGRLRLRRG
jgi:hypothetical protein